MHMKDGIVFEQYNKDFGLSSNGITSMIKDSNGFLWLGTADGLNVFDGKNIKVYKGYLHESTLFKGKTITSLLEDSNSNILCGTQEYGLNILNRKTGLFTNINEPLFDSDSSKPIKSIVEIGSNHYAMQAGKEVIEFKLDQDFKAYDITKSLISLDEKEYARKLLFFENTLYLNTNKRIVNISSDNFETILTYQYLKDSKIRNNKLWLNVDKSIGFLSKNSSEVTWIDYKFEDDIDEIEDYYLDFDVSHTNEIWIGTKRKLLHLTLNNQNEVKASKEIYNNEAEIYKVLIDDLQNVYLAVARGQGFLKIDGRQHQYNYIKLPKGYEDVYRHSFVEDKNGIYWIGGNTGIFAYNTKTKSYHKFKNNSYKGLEDLKINHQIKDKFGKIWIGTSNGIAEFNYRENSFKFYAANLGNSKFYNQSFTHHLQTDMNQDLWYVSRNRLNYLNHKTKTHKFYEIENLGAIFIDSTNTLWAGVKNVGLVKYNIDSGVPEKEKIFIVSKEFAKLDIHNITDDTYGRLWINNFNGIYVFDAKKDKILFHGNRNNVLKHERLYGITPDKRGNFWVPQYNFPSVCISSETFEIVEISPVWMRRDNNTDIYAGPATIDKNGKIFIEGHGGFFVYNADSLKINATPPKVVLHNLKLNGSVKFDNFLGNKLLNLGELNYNENSIEVSLKPVNAETSYTTQYAYRLLGNNDQWNYSKELETINFSGLQPDSYQLQVKSTNNGTDWSEPIVVASFQIFPPWWQTKYAYMVYLLLAILLIYVFYKTQLNKKLAESETQKLKEVDDFKNKFYQNITHEFRTPLTVITGLANQIKDKKSPIIKRNAEQLLGLVNELLEIGQIETNTTKLNISTQDVVSYSKYCVESLHSLAKDKNIELKFETNKEEIFMDYDTQKYQLIINNLLHNAIKFTPTNGKINFSINELSDNICIEVKDSGPGINKANLKTIFNRYQRSINEQNPNGIGIGLSLTKELVTLMNGNITAENNLDKGANFKMEFPLAVQSTQHIPKSQLNDSELKINKSDDKDLILVIEDNDDVRNYILSVIETDYNVVTADNGKDGAAKALELIPDIIISDVMMPLMNGYEVCNNLKNEEKTDHIPIILLTAKADLQSKIEGITKGADIYLSKPFSEEELLAHLNNLVKVREKFKKKLTKELSKIDSNQKPISNPFLSKIQKLVLDQLDNDTYGINEICNDLATSRTQLHRKIKAITGLSTSIFLRELRLNEGYKLIKNIELSISEIAYQTGFSDPNYFSKLFTEKYNTTPTDLRKELLNTHSHELK